MSLPVFARPGAQPCTGAELQEMQRKVPFVGLDIYSLAASSDAVIKFLDETDPEAAQRARQRYGCFDKCARFEH